jgi:ubiquinone biosynthesis protein UbiJ
MEDISRFPLHTACAPQIPRQQMEQLLPAMGRLTDGQIQVLANALKVLPSHAWDVLAGMMRKLGPVTDVVVQQHQSKGILSTTAGRRLAQSGSSTADAPAATSSPAAAAPSTCEPAVAVRKAAAALI